MHKCVKYTLDQYVRMTGYLKSLWSFGSLLFVIRQMFSCSVPLKCIFSHFDAFPLKCIASLNVSDLVGLYRLSVYLLFGLFCTLRCKNHRNVLGQNEMPWSPQCLGLWTSLCELELCLLAWVCLCMNICMRVLDDYWMNHEKFYFHYSFFNINSSSAVQYISKIVLIFFSFFTIFDF